jgi:hypothetical protein
MDTTGRIRISGVEFCWYVESGTMSYPGFSSRPIDVLRIVASEKEFDIVLWLRQMEFRGGSRILLASPIVVLSQEFPTSFAPAKKGARIRIRPKVSVFRDARVTDHGVRRIVEWCLSRHFRAVQCDVHGFPQASPQDDYSVSVPPSRVEQ